ncbi:MAG: hypothetical protein AAF611_12250 [Bacteroidota bacterium]
MKKISILFILLCFTVSTVNAQKGKDSKDAVLEDVTNDVCNCISGKVKQGISQKDIEVQLGLCLIKSYGKFKDRIDKYMNITFDDPRSMELFGQEIGMKMISLCPDTFMTFAKDMIEEEVDTYRPSKRASASASAVTLVSGEVTKLTRDQFNVVSFRDSNKRTYKFLWMEYFDGQELLNDMRNLKRKQVEISFENKEMYDPKLEDYRTFKVLRKIEVIN